MILVGKPFQFPKFCPRDPNLESRILWETKALKKLSVSWSPISILIKRHFCYGHRGAIKPIRDHCPLHPEARHMGLLESQGFGNEKQLDIS